MKKYLSALLTAAVLLLTAGCTEEVPQASQTQPTAATNPQVTAEQMFTDRDQDAAYDPKQCIPITLSDDGVRCDSDGVEITPQAVTLKQEAVYLISGSWSSGSIVIDMAGTAKPQLVLSGASITSQTDAPLKILGADKVFVTLADGTSNSLTNGGSFESEADGAVYSQQDLTFNGSGSLSVTSPAGHGIVCKDDLVFTGGSYTLSSASHGCDANDSVRVTNTTLTIEAGKDGIHCENDDPEKGFIFSSQCTIDATAQGDGISAGTYLQIESGTYSIVTGGGSENGTKEHSDQWGDFMGGGHGGRPGRPRTAEAVEAAETEESTSIKGLKAGTSLVIMDGSFHLNTADDSIHANSVSIQGGSFQIASGDDGVHADETLTVTGGDLTITESYEALEGLHVDIQGGDLTVTASDDGINAAGGTDDSGNGGRDGMFGGGMFGGGPGGMGGGPGGMGGASNGSITINGGSLNVTASGDGLDANGTLAITGGYTIVSGPTQGDTATLDYDTSGTISGGTFIGTGAAGMAQSFSGGTQGVIALSVGQLEAGTAITVKNAQGSTLLTHSPQLSFGVVILSSPEIIKGESYTVTIGTQSGTFEAA